MRPHVNIIQLEFVSAATDPLHQSAWEEARLSLPSLLSACAPFFLLLYSKRRRVRCNIPPPVLRRDAQHADWIDTSADSADIRGDERRTVKRPLANTAQGLRLGTAVHAEGKHMFGSRKIRAQRSWPRLFCSALIQPGSVPPARLIDGQVSQRWRPMKSKNSVTAV